MKVLPILGILLGALTIAFSQPSTISATITPPNGQPFTVQTSAPVFKFDNPHGYWFTNPHTSERHFNFQPDAGYGDADAAFINFTTQSPDIDLFENQKDAVFMLSNKKYGVTAPHSGAALHIHIDAFSASEISFTISGMATYSMKDGQRQPNAKIEGTGHFYREPKYDQSDVLPGCDCDPVIYAKVYDAENLVRTTSACEMALNNKIFDAVQKSLAPIYTNVKYNGTQSPIPAGAITVNTIAGHLDVSGPPRQRPYCSTDYHTNWRTGLDAHKKLFINDDSYGILAIKMPSKEALNPTSFNSQAYAKNVIKLSDSVSRLVAAKKISNEQAMRILSDIAKAPVATSVAQDFKKMNVEHNLKIWITFNSYDRESLLVKLADKANSVVQHNIQGAAFEILSPQFKDYSGDWIPNRKAIYFGKFTAPVLGKSNGGFDALTTTIQYPADANKLSIHSIIVRLEGGIDMIDQAVANIDFTSLQSLLSK